ncbi:MAG: hypothetical protein H8D34_17770 [Chloroflexi bacterium]|nr:hypothetical protein [Chloroflexota bacterium]
MKTTSNEPPLLGTLQNSYHPRALPGKVLLGSAIFCGLMSVLELITAVNKYLGPPNTVLSDRYRQDAIMIAAVLSVVFFLLAIALSALYFAHKKHRVDLYEYGIVVVTWRGSTDFPWRNIDDLKMLPIYGRSRRPVNWDITVVRNDDVAAKFRGLEGLTVLIKTIERKIAVNDGY